MLNSLTKADWDSNLPIYKIAHSKLFKKDIKCLLLDVDGTLLNRNSVKIPETVKNWILKSKKLFKIYLISNNPSEKRISRIGEELGINYKFKALKPSKKCTLEVIEIMNEEKSNIAIIGDRILTDVLVGNRCKIQTILVKKLNKNGFPLKFNFTLFLEKFITFFVF